MGIFINSFSLGIDKGIAIYDHQARLLVKRGDNKMEISNKVDIKYNKKCSLSLVLAILSMITHFGLILGILGLIYGILGLQEAKSFRQKGKSIAMIGIIGSLLGIILKVFYYGW